MHSSHFLINLPVNYSLRSGESIEQSISLPLTLLMHSSHFLRNLPVTLQSKECLLSNPNLTTHLADALYPFLITGILHSTECLLSNQSVDHSPYWCTPPISSLTCRWSRPERRWVDATGHSLLTQRVGKGDNQSRSTGIWYGIYLFYITLSFSGKKVLRSGLTFYQ